MIPSTFVGASFVFSFWRDDHRGVTLGTVIAATLAFGVRLAYARIPEGG